ncbi:MAG: hypothetical protein HN976_23720 [Lentisphaerae bacterium]|nr:hypothetical protein [Lentisphaerota bacterium]
MSLTGEQITRTLSRDLLKGRHTRAMMDYYREKLPQLQQPECPDEWRERTERIRTDLLAKVYLKGHKPGILHEPPKVEWRGTIETKHGYRIRKLRYEGYPGMWIPGLLYEPNDVKGKVPAVLNVNGHHRGGKAMPYKQARCINLAKRGMLALNTEFVGMGELQGSAFHMHQGHMDLCGTAGVGVMYLAMKRGLDVLLAHENADHERVAMTGLSGGGWQTAVLSALDERIRLTVPVSGHSPIWHRATVRWQDHGDLEQTPVDLCTVADYDTLTAMFAPRPALLIHSVNDGIFRPEFMVDALYKPAREIYDLLGVRDHIQFYANEDPGTHNYESDNREQFYACLKRSWDLGISTEDIPCAEDEILSEWELNVGLPGNNPTFLGMAADLATDLPAQRSTKETASADRGRLREVLRLLEPLPATAARVGNPRPIKGISITNYVLEMDRWLVPAVELCPLDVSGTTVILTEGKRAHCSGQAQAAVNAGQRVLVVDLFSFGEQVIAEGQYHPYFMESVCAGGDRPLGIAAAQFLALLNWLGTGGPSSPIHVAAQGLSTSLIALCATALEPERVTSMDLNLPDTLRRLIDWQIEYVQHPAMFCFGLLKQFDIEDLIGLSSPVRIEIAGRGPMR